MAHECPDCGQCCYCNGDIDDLLLDLRDAAHENAELTRRVAELQEHAETIKRVANTEIGALRKHLDVTERERDELRQRYRYCLWMHHGHMGLYGDDGEMQCAECVADFKRDPIEQLEQKVLVARAALRASESREEKK